MSHWIIYKAPWGQDEVVALARDFVADVQVMHPTWRAYHHDDIALVGCFFMGLAIYAAARPAL